MSDEVNVDESSGEQPEESTVSDAMVAREAAEIPDPGPPVSADERRQAIKRLHAENRAEKHERKAGLVAGRATLKTEVVRQDEA